MKRLIQPTSNSGMLVLELEPEDQKTLQKNIQTVLRKFSSSRKTKAVHKLNEKNMIELAIFGGDAAHKLVAPSVKGNVLGGLFMNLYLFDDSLGGTGTVKYATDLMRIEKQIKKESSFVNEKRIYNIEKLQEQKKEIIGKFFKSIDYVKLIDGVYFGWLLFLSNIAVTQDEAGKPKIITTTSDILASILKKIYSQVKGKIESEEHQLIEAIAIYFIRIYYYGESATYALNLLKKAFKEETIDAIKRAKVTQIKQFNDLAKLLSGTELIPITPETFDLQMRRMFGKYAYEEYIQASLIDFMATMATLAAPSDLFKDAYPVDEDQHRRLEELILNEQKKVRLEPKVI